MDQANQAPSAWIKNRSMRLFLYSPKQNTEKFIGDVLQCWKCWMHTTRCELFLKTVELRWSWRSGNWRKRWAARLLIKRKLPHSFMISWMGTGMPLKRRLPMIPMIWEKSTDRSYSCRKKSLGLWGRNIRMCSASMNALQTAVWPRNWTMLF